MKCLFDTSIWDSGKLLVLNLEGMKVCVASYISDASVLYHINTNECFFKFWMWTRFEFIKWNWSTTRSFDGLGTFVVNNDWNIIIIKCLVYLKIVSPDTLVSGWIEQSLSFKMINQQAREALRLAQAWRTSQWVSAQANWFRFLFLNGGNVNVPFSHPSS